MQRILDLDLDFFVKGVEYWRGPGDGRLDASEYPPWPVEDAISFLVERCGLDGQLPGFVVENHGELFPLWRQALERGELVPPFHVTHVDAHADLGLGDAGYKYLMTELLFEAPEDRRSPKLGESGLGDGNYLAFAIACRWISGLVYVFNEGEANDIMSYFMEGFDPDAAHIQLAALNENELKRLMYRETQAPKVERLEPRVPFKSMHWRSFESSQPFDIICLARSPTYTPSESDAIFDEIRRRFIEEADSR
jgi:hypothetical protein